MWYTGGKFERVEGIHSFGLTPVLFRWSKFPLKVPKLPSSQVIFWEGFPFRGWKGGLGIFLNSGKGEARGLFGAGFPIGNYFLGFKGRFGKKTFPNPGGFRGTRGKGSGGFGCKFNFLVFNPNSQVSLPSKGVPTLIKSQQPGGNLGLLFHLDWGQTQFFPPGWVIWFPRFGVFRGKFKTPGGLGLGYSNPHKGGLFFGATPRSGLEKPHSFFHFSTLY